MLTLVLVGFVSSLTLYYLLLWNDNSYPAGPFMFPMIGNLPQLARFGSVAAFAEYYKKIYGNIFTFEFGGNKRVVLSGYDTIHKLLVKNADDTSNRSANSMTGRIREIIKTTPGILWAPFPHWKTLRSFTISTLREEGMGKSSIEPRIHEEIQKYISHFIEPNLGKSFRVDRSLVEATCNVISQLLFAKRFEYNDKDLQQLISGLDDTIVLNVKIALVEYLPFGKYFLKATLAQEKFIYEEILQAKLQSIIDEHNQSVDTENPRDVTDRYIIHSKQAKDDPYSENKFCFSEENAWVVSFHLFGAGAETTATELRWAFLFVCLHPVTLKTTQNEIDEQIGRDRPVSYKDRLKMPYTEAVLLETLRRGNVAATSLPHCADRELVIDGVKIPAGADLMLNMASVLHDETVFEEPKKFKPERYLTGDIVLKKQRTIPFGIGRRACPGESLAKMELFLFFVTILQRFDISLPEGSKVTEEPVKQLLHAPQLYDLIFSPRH